MNSWWERIVNGAYDNTRDATEVRHLPICRFSDSPPVTLAQFCGARRRRHDVIRGAVWLLKPFGPQNLCVGDAHHTDVWFDHRKRRFK